MVSAHTHTHTHTHIHTHTHRLTKRQHHPLSKVSSDCDLGHVVQLERQLVLKVKINPIQLIETNINLNLWNFKEFRRINLATKLYRALFGMYIHVILLVINTVELASTVWNYLITSKLRIYDTST